MNHLSEFACLRNLQSKASLHWLPHSLPKETHAQAPEAPCVRPCLWLISISPLMIPHHCVLFPGLGFLKDENHRKIPCGHSLTKGPPKSEHTELPFKHSQIECQSWSHQHTARTVQPGLSQALCIRVTKVQHAEALMPESRPGHLRNWQKVIQTNIQGHMTVTLERSRIHILKAPGYQTLIGCLFSFYWLSVLQSCLKQTRIKTPLAPLPRKPGL